MIKLEYAQHERQGTGPPAARVIFNIFALASLLFLLLYWFGVVRYWTHLVLFWRREEPGRHVDLGDYWLQILIGLPLAVVPLWWAIDRIVRGRRRLPVQNALS